MSRTACQTKSGIGRRAPGGLRMGMGKLHPVLAIPPVEPVQTGRVPGNPGPDGTGDRGFQISPAVPGWFASVAIFQAADATGLGSKIPGAGGPAGSVAIISIQGVGLLLLPTVALRLARSKE